MTIVAMNKIQGLSIRKIAQMTGKHRNTVKRYLEGNEFPQYHRCPKETKLDAFRQTIDDFLSEDAYQATWIYDRLKAMGYTGAYESVKVYVRGLKWRFRTKPATDSVSNQPPVPLQIGH